MIQVFIVLMEFIKTEFILNSQKDQNTASHADGQTHDVDERISPVPFNISQCGFYVIIEHFYYLSKNQIYIH